MKNFIFYSLVMIFLWSCASNQKNVDYDPSTNFASYKNYAWSEKTDEHTGKSRIDTPLVHQRVRESIESALSAKGLQKVDPTQADILVTYHLSVAAVGHTGGSVSLGLGRYSGRSSVGVSVGVPVGGRVVEEGTLVIDIIDAKKNSVVWQGYSSQKLSSGQTSPEQAKEKINQTVNTILANYPPVKK